MSKSIELSLSTYSRLAELAQGFDTPETVIIRLLDAHIQTPRIHHQETEFKNLSKLSKWAAKPHQGNSQIIQTYLNLCPNNQGIDETVFIQTLAQKGVYDGANTKIQNNLNAMRTDGGNAHGKFFQKVKSIYQLYDEVFDEVRKFFEPQGE